jgi:hypothetical protein
VVEKAERRAGFEDGVVSGGYKRKRKRERKKMK